MKSKNGEIEYLNCLETVLTEGKLIPNRTGISALTVPHLTIQHDMSDGFPLLTTKKMAFKTIRVELEGFLQGITNKRWFQERGCRIWNEWCNPTKVPEGLSDEERKAFMLQENDLGPIYGYQWRSFNGDSSADQVKAVVETLKTDPQDRRMLCSAWNPLALAEQALPPCHLSWHLTVINDTLNLCWLQRSVDAFLGLPFNLASYGLLLHLLAKEAGLKEGRLTGFLSNVHIYENHVAVAEEQLKREPFGPPQVETSNFTSIFDWTHKDTKVIGYKCHPALKAEIAV